MIVVGPFIRARGLWKAGGFYRMTSDDSVRELLDFAAGLGLRLSWYRPEDTREHPHFELSVPLRALAVRRGARLVSTTAYAAAKRRLHEREVVAQAAREGRP